MTRRPLLAVLLLAACAAHPGSVEVPAWQPLFGPEAQAGWIATDFGGQGEVRFAGDRVELDQGSPLTGITWQRPFPDRDYEIELLASRTLGNDFFLGLTFPVGSQHLTLVLGGWGGTVCGLSCLDGDDAARNATRTLRSFATGTVHRVHLTVQLQRLRVELDGAPFLDVDLRGHQLSLRPEVRLCRPLGCASYATAATLQRMRWRPLPSVP